MEVSKRELFVCFRGIFSATEQAMLGLREWHNGADSEKAERVSCKICRPTTSFIQFVS